MNTGFFIVYTKRIDEERGWHPVSSYSDSEQAKARADRAARLGLHAIVNDPEERQIYEAQRLCLAKAVCLTNEAAASQLPLPSARYGQGDGADALVLLVYEDVAWTTSIDSLDRAPGDIDCSDLLGSVAEPILQLDAQCHGGRPRDIVKADMVEAWVDSSDRKHRMRDHSPVPVRSGERERLRETTP